MAESGPFESDGRPQSTHCQSHCSKASVLSSQDQLGATVWVEHAKGKESQPFVVEYLLVDTRRNAHKSLLHLDELASTRFCRAL
jgi:hypothetical protein